MRVRRGGIDYHIDVEGHFYSVPYRFARKSCQKRNEVLSKSETNPSSEVLLFSTYLIRTLRLTAVVHIITARTTQRTVRTQKV